ncbi:hypothetical protein L6452_37419 [Arctium lappa]|uniref:Uncharacterized protein n=1 Tax=Arctium lappa TaxID=4217 RepID=A0ACB8Y261_ARCLA|nr:hypothetical protein L6452_37419 [Arctium lappa]
MQDKIELLNGTLREQDMEEKNHLVFLCLDFGRRMRSRERDLEGRLSSSFWSFAGEKSSKMTSVWSLAREKSSLCLKLYSPEEWGFTKSSLCEIDVGFDGRAAARSTDLEDATHLRSASPFPYRDPHAPIDPGVRLKPTYFLCVLGEAETRMWSRPV